MKIMFVTLFLFITSFAHSETFKIFLVLAENHVNVTSELAINMYEDVNYLIKRDTAHALTLQGLGTLNTGTPPTLATYVAHKGQALIKARQTYPICKQQNVQCVIIDHPIIDSGVWYVAELTDKCQVRSKGQHKPFPWVAALFANQNGVDRYTHSVIAMAHGLGHHLGASHAGDLQGPNIMHPYVLDFVDAMHYSLQFVQVSKQQINTCLNK